jgi:hypothetical protein
MNTTTRTTTIPATGLGYVLENIAKVNAKLAKRGFAPVDVTVGEREVIDTDPVTGVRIYGHTVSITYGEVALPGGWELVAVAEWPGTDEALVWNLTDPGVFGADLVPDRGRCDHCNTRRNRAAVFAVRNTDGAVQVIGRTCLADYLGHSVEHVLALPGILADLDDLDEWAGASASSEVPTVEFVTAAAVAVRAFGWHAASDWNNTPTKLSAGDVLFRRLGDDDKALVAAVDITAAEAHAAAAIEWAAGLNAEPGSFDANLAAVARAEWIGRKAFGIAAYLPVAYDRHLDAEAHKAKVAEVKAAAEPCPAGRVTIVGEVVGLKDHDNGYQVVEKMTVMADQGWRVWVTVPSSIEVVRGDRVEFVATIEVSDNDATFGFAKRPTKARVLAEA